MLTPLFGFTNGSPSTSAVNYTSVVCCAGATPTSTESARLIVVPAAFTMKNLYVSVSAAPSGVAQYVYTIRKNQVNTALSVTISGSNTSATDTVDSVSFAAGDTISLSMTPTGTPTAPASTTWNFLSDSGGTHFSLLLGAAHTTTGLSTSASSFATLPGASNSAASWSATEALQEFVCPTAGTINNLYVITDTAAGSAKSYAIALVKNGTASSLSATVTGTSTKTANDTTHSVSVAAGDTLSIIATPTSTPTVGRYSWGFEFTPTNPGESITGFGSGNAPSVSATQYELPLSLGNNGWNSTESSRQLSIGTCTVTALYALLGTAPGSGKSRSITLRQNAANTTATTTISNTNVSGNITGVGVGLAQTDLISLQASESGTPAADTNGVHVGILMFISTTTTNSGFFGFMG
jgi:hypothetical protein